MNDREELARLLPVPEGRDLPAGRKQILKEHLMTELRRQDQSRRPRRGLVAVVAVAAAAAATATAVLVTGTTTPGHSRPPAAGTQPRTAAQLLARIADAAASQPAPDVKDSDFTYIRSMDAYTTYTVTAHGETSAMAPLRERQIWLPVADLCAPGLLIENGERTLISPFPVVNGKIDRTMQPQPDITCPTEGHLGDTTYRLLQSIPTQRDALLAYLKAGKKWTNDDPPTEIGDLIREAIIPPALAAALYRLAATLPGATLVPHATNATGQAGIGIMWTSKSAKQVYKNEWIFDKTTLQFIGEKIFDPKTGKVTGESAILQRAFTAKAGQLP